MKLFGGVIPVTGITFLLFCVFAILVVGYALGRITIKGINLGSAGVFIIALLFGALLYSCLTGDLGVTQKVTIGDLSEKVSIASSALKIIQNLGLILFVGSVGLIAGPTFFKAFKENFKSYILIGFVIILSGALVTAACYGIGMTIGGETDGNQLIAMCVGLMAGSLTSTPAFSAANASVATEYASVVSVGYGIAYIFGVIGVVLFVQLLPKILKSDIAAERAKISVQSTGNKAVKDVNKKLIEVDDFGLAAFALTAVLGIILGAIKIPLSGKGLSGTCFSLTATGGVLLMGLILGHFGHCGPISLKTNTSVLKCFREFGLVLFLLGAGIPGGADFVKYFKPIYFVYGVFITLIPMVIGFFFAYKLLKLPLFNVLGSITGGMTSTPALGTLIQTAGTEDVAAAYASTYPVALIFVVLCAQFLILIFTH